MDKEDMLITFEDHIRKLEQDEDDLKRRDKERERRNQRKNRDGFQVYTMEFNGSLNSSRGLKVLQWML